MIIFIRQALCDDTINTATFERSIYIGLVFSSMYFIVGFLVDIVGKKLILVTILSVTGLCGIGAHLAYNQQLAVVLFAVFQMCGACIGLMNAVAVELFPTNYRYVFPIVIVTSFQSKVYIHAKMLTRVLMGKALASSLIHNGCNKAETSFCFCHVH